MEDSDALLAAARDCANEGLEGHALRRYRKLDKLLSQGEAPIPRAWALAPLPSTDLWKEEN